MDTLINALAGKADVGTLVAVLFAGLMWWDKQTINKLRSEDAKTFAEALTHSAKITSEAINQSTAALNRMTDHMISKGGGK